MTKKGLVEFILISRLKAGIYYEHSGCTSHPIQLWKVIPIPLIVFNFHLEKGR